MNAKMNGNPMFGIGYGEASGVEELLLVGRKYCARHLGAVPKLTRAQVERLGGVFPREPVQPVSKPKKLPPRPKQLKKYEFVSPEERAEIVALYAGGNGVRVLEIAKRMKRPAPSIRSVLKAAKVYQVNPRFGVVREKVLAAFDAGVPVDEIGAQVGTCQAYVRTVLCEAGRLERRKAEGRAA